jgi:hypothetical protein
MFSLVADRHADPSVGTGVGVTPKLEPSLTKAENATNCRWAGQIRVT